MMTTSAAMGRRVPAISVVLALFATAALVGCGQPPRDADVAHAGSGPVGTAICTRTSPGNEATCTTVVCTIERPGQDTLLREFGLSRKAGKVWAEGFYFCAKS